MRRARYLSIIILLLASSALCRAQGQQITYLDDNPDTTGNSSTFFPKQEYRILKKSMRLGYQKPDGFKEVVEMDCFKEYSQLENIITCAWNQLHSDDEQCVVFIQLFPPVSENNEWFINRNKGMSPDNPSRVIDMQYMGQTSSHIIYALGYDYLTLINPQRGINWRQYLEYYPETQAQELFNADAAYRYSLNLEPGKKYNYKGKYDFLDVLLLQKGKGRGYITLFVFTTEKGKENLPFYWKQIEGVFRYED